MTKIKKILVPVDFSPISELAVIKAISLSEILQSELHLIHIISFNPDHFAVLPEYQRELPAIREIESAVEDKLKELKDFIKKDSGLEASTYYVTGDVHHEIINYTEQNDIDLIIMGTHGASGYKELFIGSNSQKVVTLSPVPVITLKNVNDDKEFKDILIPIDNSLLSREKIKIAVVLAKVFDSNIHILGLPSSESKTDHHKIEIKCKSLEKILNDEGISHKLTYRNGTSLAKLAMEYADEINCDLIIINTGQESEITGVYLGLFAQQIVNHSHVPVLSYRNSEAEYRIGTPGYGIS